MEVAAAEREIPKVVVRKVVRADPKRVFEAWTNPALLGQWLHPNGGKAQAQNSLHVGGSYSVEMLAPEGKDGCGGGIPDGKGNVTYPHKGEYLEISPPTRLVFTWSSPAVSNTRVTVELRAVSEGTEITLTHELLGSVEQRTSHTEGWEECLGNLAKLLAPSHR